GDHPLAELAEALRCAAGGRVIDELSHERVVQVAFRRATMQDARVTRGAWRLGIVMGGVAAAAAATLFVFQPSAPPLSARRTTTVFIASHSTVGLFDAQQALPRFGGESSRIDRIAAVRDKQLRANRFASWGVR
ncbi:MAG: hypothetical protein VB934_02355, partial [Polyangiaceae bacterium]